MQMQLQMQAQAGKNLPAVPVPTPPEQAQHPAAEAAVGEPSVDETLYALGQIAEESAQLAVSAAAFCSNQAAADPTQVQAMAESAQQASQKASWAAQTMETYDPAPSVKASWTATMRQIGKAAAEAAQHATDQCFRYANRVKADDEADGEGGKGDGKRGGKVPCK